MSNGIDISRYSVAASDGPESALPRRITRGPFLKGPIPWDWVTAAACLPGKALHVGVALWQRAGKTKSRKVGLNLSRLDELGVGRSTASRALMALERAQLVSVERKHGRHPRVTILKCPRSPESIESGGFGGASDCSSGGVCQLDD